MTDLTDLSREIAATSDAWMVPGVQVMTNTDCPVLLTYRRNGVWFGIWGDWRDLETVLPRDIVGPDLADTVTVNALLGEGEIQWDASKTYWIATIGKGGAACPTRTHAICRAWIAAHKGSDESRAVALDDRGSRKASRRHGTHCRQPRRVGRGGDRKAGGDTYADATAGHGERP